MTNKRVLLWLLVAMAVCTYSGLYFSSEEAFKYVNASLRFWLIFIFGFIGAGAIAAKAYYTESIEPDKSDATKDVLTTKESIKTVKETTTETPKLPPTPPLEGSGIV